MSTHLFSWQALTSDVHELPAYRGHLRELRSGALADNLGRHLLLFLSDDPVPIHVRREYEVNEKPFHQYTFGAMSLRTVLFGACGRVGSTRQP